MDVAANGVISFFPWLSDITQNICTTPFLSYSPGSKDFSLLFFFHFSFSTENFKPHFSPISVVFLKLSYLRKFKHLTLGKSPSEREYNSNACFRQCCWKASLVLSESCEITHRSCRKRELFNFSSSEGGICMDNHEVRTDSNTN